MKERLDVLLVNLGYAPSREKAKAVIMSGCVYVNGQKEDKAGTMFDTYAAIEVRGNSLKYVSRGGLKLEKAMEEFAIALDQKTCMDVGASTGGFTVCFKMVLLKSLRWMSVMVSLHGVFEMIRVSFVWRRRISAMLCQRILDAPLILCQLTFHLSHLQRYLFR